MACLVGSLFQLSRDSLIDAVSRYVLSHKPMGDDEIKGTRKKEEEEPRMTTKKMVWSSVGSIFMHADATDKVLMALGFVGAVGDGFSTPLVLFISSHLMNNIGGASGYTMETFLHNINKVSLALSFS